MFGCDTNFTAFCSPSIFIDNKINIDLGDGLFPHNFPLLYFHILSHWQVEDEDSVWFSYLFMFNVSP